MVTVFKKENTFDTKDTLTYQGAGTEQLKENASNEANKLEWQHFYDRTLKQCGEVYMSNPVT